LSRIFFHLLVGAEEHGFDGAVERAAFLEQRGKRRAGPAQVADGAHETGIRAVAGTFERGGNSPAFARLDVGERKPFRLLHQAGDFQLPFAGVHFGCAVVLHLVKFLIRRDPTRQVLPVKHLPFRLHVEERDDGFIRARLVEA